MLKITDETLRLIIKLVYFVCDFQLKMVKIQKVNASSFNDLSWS